MKLLIIILGVLASLSSTTHAGYSDVNGGRVYSNDGKSFVVNSGYNLPPGGSLACWLNDQNNWGGRCWMNYSNGGVGAGQIVIGKAITDENDNYTVDSPYPLRVGTNGGPNTNWNHWIWQYQQGHGTSNARWQMYYEIWIHSSLPCRGANTVLDLMIMPDYSELPSSYNYKREAYIRGQQYGVYMEIMDWGWPAPMKGPLLVKYFRRNKTRDTGAIELSAFWRDAANTGWCKTTDWVENVTAGCEVFSGYVDFQSKKFINNVYR